ncbi:MAG TPA: serpin family protein [Chitinispirillaceae bacterium]|nr:serpin family protein [Chitinispirillaceae bacterium]
MKPKRKTYPGYRVSITAIITISTCLLHCAFNNEETETKPANHNLKNSTSAFIYNMIPENAGAIITSAYSTAINTFSVNLFGEIYKSSLFHDKNLVLSPYCISRNLAIITDASVGETQQELLAAIGGRVALDDAHSALGHLLYADKSVILQIADGIWVDSTMYVLQPAFRDTANRKYGIETFGLDFGNVPECISTMNKWIAANTANNIKNAVTRDFFEPRPALFVNSTIYFKADWTSPFDITKTEPYPFVSPSGTVNVQMMTSSQSHKTRKTADYHNVKIYYGTNREDFFYLDIYMPQSMSTDEFIEKKCLSALSEKDSMQYGGLRMPKFFFENVIDLKPPLQGLGVKDAFDFQLSQISGIVTDKATSNKSNLYITHIKHTAGIRTDEEGTVAYAVTVTAGAGNCAVSGPDVTLDHPFVFFIRAGNTGMVLFAGVFNNPAG